MISAIGENYAVATESQGTAVCRCSKKFGDHQAVDKPREAMRMLHMELMGGEGKTVEIDETLVGEIIARSCVATARNRQRLFRTTNRRQGHLLQRQSLFLR